ncbi:MAG: GGDEF domain-containing protein [Candidatus Gastranaerophilales bacterium]|nr:GGDEF domain-containing protein [Candidatus Gastranaerophilales bacterium]
MLINDGKIGVFPLIGKKTLGCIVANSNTNKLSAKEIDYLDQLSRQSSITIQRANSYAEVLKHATLDALTGLNNRRQFETRLNQEIASVKRQNTPLCSIMIDIDFFKKVNDTYGHIAGDCVLKTIANVIKRELRESDIASRYGGEEFSVLLPFTKIDEAYAVAERLRKAVEETSIEVQDEKDNTLKVSVTISLGVYEYRENDSPQEFYQKADKALYESKTTGRNKISVFK